MQPPWIVGVDIGGTFTDLVGMNELTGERIHLKVDTTPADPSGGFLEALEQLCTRAGIERDSIRLIVHGTTLATNAIIERRISPTALVTTKGFKDVLEIGRHWRNNLYDPLLEVPQPIVPRFLRLEAEERLDAQGHLIQPLDTADVDAILDTLEQAEVDAVAVVFLHSYANTANEEEFVQLLQARFGDRLDVCASSQLSQEPREYERTATTVLNAALMRLVDDYLSTLERRLVQAGGRAVLYITQSSGGAFTPAIARKRPINLVQSGPAAGVTGCLEVGRLLREPHLIAFDMGGTSTDVALIEDGAPRLAMELTVAEIPVRTPSVRIHSIGAGGGSIAWVDEAGALRVGPRSSGSVPGPACYDRGGIEPTVTDCHLVLGRLSGRRPLAEFLTLDEQLARRAVRSHLADPLGLSIEGAAQGVIDIVNAAMEGAIRVVLRERGDDPRNFALLAFGGAGPLHAVELASRLSIATVIVPLRPGTLSAFGLLSSDLRQDFSLTRVIRASEPDAANSLAEALADLEHIAREQTAGLEGFEWDLCERDIRCDVRYIGQAYEVTVPLSTSDNPNERLQAVVADFHKLHERAYAFANPDEPCEVVTHRLALTTQLASGRLSENLPVRSAAAPQPIETRSIFYDHRNLECAELVRDGLRPDSTFAGPAIVHQSDATTFIPPGATATVISSGDIKVTGIQPT
jgi:N-methylhydantoinase A